MSLKKLQKMVQGYRGKAQAPTGVSEFSTWFAFEETASLLWENAFSFNEDDSEIYALAEELKDYFKSQLQEARVVVPEPSQPGKIKLKVPSATESAQPITARRITLQVPGRGGSADSPGPPTTNSADSTTRSVGLNGAGRLSLAVDKGRSLSASVTSPTPSVPSIVKREEATRNSPAAAAIRVGPPSSHLLPNGTVPQNQRAPALERNRRLQDRTVQDAVLSSLQIRTPPQKTVMPNPVSFEIFPDPINLHQSVTLNVPTNQTHLQVLPKIASFVASEHRQYKLFMIFNNQILRPMRVDGSGIQLYEIQLTIGRINTIEVHLVVAIPKNQRQPDGPEAEVERVTVMFNVMRS